MATVAETCRQPNKTDTKTVVFWRTHPLLIREINLVCTLYVYIMTAFRHVRKISKSDYKLFM